MFKKQGTSIRSASTSIGDIKPGFGSATPTDMGSQASACDMAWACEELLELDEEELATVVGGVIPRDERLPSPHVFWSDRPPTRLPGGWWVIRGEIFAPGEFEWGW